MGTMVSMEPASNSCVVDNLLAKVDAAQVAFDRKQPSVAVQLLQTFIQEVEAQKGKHIRAERASSLMTQARTVINAIISTKASTPAFLKAGLSSLHYAQPVQHEGGMAADPAVRLAAALDPSIKV
jgi:hypothetical protein